MKARGSWVRTRRLRPTWRHLGGLVVGLLLLACTTTVHRADCTCRVGTPSGEVQLEQRTEEFKRRPILDRITDAVLDLMGAIGL